MVQIKIPKIFHQVWTSLDGKSNPGEMSKDYKYYQKTWIKNHPGWKLKYGKMRIYFH